MNKKLHTINLEIGLNEIRFKRGKTVLHRLEVVYSKDRRSLTFRLGDSGKLDRVEMR